MNPVQFRDAIGANAYHWGLDEFAAGLGLNPADDYTRQLFLDFQEAARCLRKFDARNIELIAQPRPESDR
jgi:hypothetical protein